MSSAEKIKINDAPHSATVIPFAGKISIFDAALSLSAKGIAVHWLRREDKIPVDKNWSTAPIATPEQLKNSYRPGYNLGIRTGAPSDLGGVFLHVLDLDVRDENRAAEAYAWLDANWPNWRAAFPTVQSGSGGSSRHVYFFTTKAYRSRKIAQSKERVIYNGKPKQAWEIEIFGTGKQVAAPPSIHPVTGQPYRWVTPLYLDDFDLGIYPMIEPAIIEAWSSPVEPTRSEHPNKDRLGLTLDEAKAILAKLPFEEWNHSRDGWVAVGMALQHEFGDAGRELWDEFSAQSDKFDPDEQTKVWKSFRPRPDSLRMATLMSAARAVEIAEAFDELTDDEGDAHDDEKGEDLLGGPTIPAARKSVAAAGDIEAGKRFAEFYANQFLYVFCTKSWLHWTGARWETCQRGEEIEATKRLAVRMVADAAAASAKSASKKNEARLGYALKLTRDNWRLRAVLDSARSVKSIVRVPDDFDRDPMLLGVQNGVLNLDEGVLVPPEPDQLISKQSGAAFDQSAKCPMWNGFLERVLPDAGIRRLVQICAGYTLTGNVDAEMFFFAHGIGANGKSVFANVLAALLRDYAVTVGTGLMTKTRYEGENDRLMATLPGARLVLANETRHGDVWDDKHIKTLSSREEISARKLYSEPFSFMPTHKLWIRGNHLPGAQDNSEGFWRRLVPMPFTVNLSPAERIPDLDRQIIATELPGVLNWAVEGCLAWKREGIVLPAEIRKLTNVYRQDTDIIGLWLSDRCELQSDAKIRVSEVFQSYKNYCIGENISPPSMPEFLRQLVERPGIRRDPSKKHGRRLIGIELKNGFDEFSEDSLI